MEKLLKYSKKSKKMIISDRLGGGGRIVLLNIIKIFENHKNIQFILCILSIF